MEEDNKSINSFKNNFLIDYKKIYEAIEYYKSKGFKNIEVPWETSKKYRDVTFEGKDFNPIEEDRYLVGSAEQSFIMLDSMGFLNKGAYVSCSPCFRGGELNEYHQEYFLKVELFDSNDTSVERLLYILKLAEDFFNRYIPVKILKTGDYEYDINTITGIEIGSYGIRKYENSKWIYGTAIAEPRLSKSLLTIK